MTDSAEVWSAFTRDPRDPRCAGLRASDQDRSVVHQVLGEAYAEGRLDREEYDERSARVAGVRVLGEVDPLLRDLVPPPTPGNHSLVHSSRRDLEQLAARTWERKRREAAFSLLGASLLTTAIWFATAWSDGKFDYYFFWPGIVIALSLANLVRTAASRSEIVEQEVGRLERKRDKELNKSRWRGDGASG